jgi:nitrogen fixation protein NifB
MENEFPFQFHPCWSNDRSNIWERIHLPVARICNIKCAFCDHRVATASHIPKPGIAKTVMTPSVAIRRYFQEKKKRPNLHIAAVSGPGEPLANKQTFETFQGIRTRDKNIELCLSTNGVLLEESVKQLRDLHVKVITVSIHSVKPRTATNIYEWAIHKKKKLHGIRMAEYIIKKQLTGIQEAIEHGIKVKINSILIPGVNETEFDDLAKSLAEIGAAIQNIVPLVPYDKMSHLRAPTPIEIKTVRESASKYIKQFTHCVQCRSDVVGIPGADSIL